MDRTERDGLIVAYHTSLAGPGLDCPVCATWSPIDLDSPQGIRLACRTCGAVSIMPRVQLVRAIGKVRRGK